MSLRGKQYDARFARLEAQGIYLHGEADLVEWLLGARRSRVLDAGCGTGRVAIELARRGHDVAGVDVDPAMLEVARARAPELPWVTADLSAPDLVLGASGFDLVVAAGNVMVFLAPETEGAVVANLARQLVPGGLLVVGFQLGGRLTLDTYDALGASAGVELVERWATWEREPYLGGDYAVSVHRRGDGQ
jgi:SAM-dependent methyltransferase